MATTTIGRVPYQGSTAEAMQHSEGCVAKMIEEQPARLPSDIFLWAASAAIIGSAALRLIGRNHDALFVGQWAASLLVLGVYDKIVKVAGSDRASEINLGG